MTDGDAIPWARRLRVGVIVCGGLMAAELALVPLLFYMRVGNAWAGPWLVSIACTFAVTTLVWLARLVLVTFAEHRLALWEVMATITAAGFVAGLGVHWMRRNTYEPVWWLLALPVPYAFLMIWTGSCWAWRRATDLGVRNPRKRLGWMASGWLLVLGVHGVAVEVCVVLVLFSLLGSGHAWGDPRIGETLLSPMLVGLALALLMIPGIWISRLRPPAEPDSP